MNASIKSDRIAIDKTFVWVYNPNTGSDKYYMKGKEYGRII